MNSNGDLSALLQGWQHDLKSPDGFNRSVWARIEAGEVGKGAVLSTLFSWVQLLEMPRFASAAVAISLFGGILLGSLQARSAQEERYLLSQNPYSAQLLNR
jgi:hypothetical protein